MKVTFEEDYRRFYTLEDYDHAKMVIKYEKEVDEISAKEWAEYLVGEALKNEADHCEEILKVTAHTARNNRACDRYCGETGDMDVWLEAIAMTWKGFIKVSGYLTDVWETGAVDYKQHLFIQKYEKV